MARRQDRNSYAPDLLGGTFWTMAGKTFYYVRDRSKYITLRLKDHEYRKVVMEVDDKESIAQDLRKLIG